MIAQSNADSVFARLVGQARIIAEAALAERQAARQDRAGRWRRAALLWPLFTKG